MTLTEFFGAVLVIGGWAATHFFSEARERRKEVRSSIDKILEKIFEAEKTSIAFHVSSSFNEASRFDLQSQVNRIERQLNRMSALKTDAFINFIVAFRRSITLNNFDPSNFQQQAASSYLLREISNACQDLEDEIEYQYDQRYPPKFPFIRWKNNK